MALPASPRRRACVAGLLAALCFPTALLAAPGARIRISNGEWPPFMGQDLPHHGIISRIVGEAFASEGVAVEYGFFPWARAYHVALHEQFEASIGWYKNAERAADFLFSDPVFVEQQVFFHLRERKFEWDRLDDLHALTIGATIGYTYGAEFKAAEEAKRLTVQRTPSDEQNLKMLLAGRIQAAVISEQVGESLLRAKFTAAEAARITTHPKPVLSGELHLIFAKSKPDSAAWLALFNRGLAKLRASGRWNELAQGMPRKTNWRGTR